MGDHLGSTSKTYHASDGDTKQQLYKRRGERRYPSASELPATWRFTGQRHEWVAILEKGFTYAQPDPKMNQQIIRSMFWS
jgi:hypothetical protein